MRPERNASIMAGSGAQPRVADRQVPPLVLVDQRSPAATSDCSTACAMPCARRSAAVIGWQGLGRAGRRISRFQRVPGVIVGGESADRPPPRPWPAPPPEQGAAMATASATNKSGRGMTQTNQVRSFSSPISPWAGVLPGRVGRPYAGLMFCAGLITRSAPLRAAMGRAPPGSRSTGREPAHHRRPSHARSALAKAISERRLRAWPCRPRRCAGRIMVPGSTSHRGRIDPWPCATASEGCANGLAPDIGRNRPAAQQALHPRQPGGSPPPARRGAPDLGALAGPATGPEVAQIPMSRRSGPALRRADGPRCRGMFSTSASAPRRPMMRRPERCPVGGSL